MTAPETVYQAAGGTDGLLRLAGAWHARVMADEVVRHAFSHGFHPEHTVRLAAYWAEALGGPTTYSDLYGDETSVVRMHSGNGQHEEMDRRAIECFDQALEDAGLAGDDRLRQVLHDYFAWATTTTMSRYHHSADDVPAGLKMPLWSWEDRSPNFAGVRIAVATCRALPPQFDDDRRLIVALTARGADAVHAVWDDPSVLWYGFDKVIIRTTWDYPHKHAAFLEWADALDGRLENPARLVRWNSDKHHIADLAAAGIPTVPTRFVEPAHDLPTLDGEVVVKPTISVGGRLTGRFGPATHDEARRLIALHHAEGRAAMVQPYLSSVDTKGETALTFIAGEFSHAAHKRAVLRPDEMAPMRDDDIGGAEVMYGPDIVEPGIADEREIAVGAQVIAYLHERFDVDPLYARVDVVHDDRGDPVLLELEAVEPNLFLGFAEGAADRLAEAILAPRSPS